MKSKYTAIGQGKGSMGFSFGLTPEDALNRFINRYDRDPELILTETEIEAGEKRIETAIRRLKS